MQNRLTPWAKKLRRESTTSETKLWRWLGGQRFLGLKFRRQYPIGGYIVDFCCPAKKLIIELDGGGHNQESQRVEDRRRDNFFQTQGFTVLRFWNSDLSDNLDGVLSKLQEVLDQLPLTPALSHQGRGKIRRTFI